MEKHHVGMNEASEALVVSNALKKIRKEQNVPPTKAIENLTSSLTTMKLLGKVESQHQASLDQDDVESTHSPSQSPTSPSSSDVMTITSSPKPVLSIMEKSNGASDSAISLTSLSSERETKRNSSLRVRSDVKPTKKLCKRTKDEDNNTILKPSTKTDGAEVHIKVNQKVILQKNTRDNSPVQKQDHNGLPSSSTSSQPPTITNTIMKTSSSPREKRELVDTIVEDQPKAKRQRLDSI